MTFSPEIVLGPPGTGKTTYLLNEVEAALEAATPPERIGFVAFTKKAATEAIERAVDRFGLSEKQLLHFRTLHSFAFRGIGMKRDKVLSSQALQEFGRIMGLRLSGSVSVTEGALTSSSPGDKALFISGLARIRCVDIQEQWEANREDLGWFETERVHRGLKKFKEARGLYDFTDMLELFVERGSVPELELLVVDEAQDLSQLQWRMVLKLAEKAKRVIVAGDDDQAIFQWAGADVPFFINLKGKTTVLDKSYRIPRKVQNKALEIVGKISERRSKTWEPRDADGGVIYHTVADEIDMGEGTWLALARNGYLLDNLEAKCRREGLIYTRAGRKSVSDRTLTAIKDWEEVRSGGEVSAAAAGKFLRWIKRTTNQLPQEGRITMECLHRDWGVTTKAIWHEAFSRMSLVERSYMIAALRRGEKLTKSPRIVLSTVHGAKGGEADNVILLSDTSQRTYKESQRYPDNERRVLYVGLTRTKNNLHVIVPKTQYHFQDL